MNNFPDYEAGRKVIRTWFGGVFAGDHVVADNIVDAALGDEALYRRDPCGAHGCMFPGHVEWIQMWPKENSDG